MNFIASLLIPAAVLVLLAAVYAFFLLSSIAIMRSRSSRIRELSNASIFGAGLARLIVIKPSSYLLTCQIGMLLVAVFTGALLIDYFGTITSDRLVTIFSFKLLIPHLFVVSAAVIVVALFTLGLAQCAKALAFSTPERTLCFVATPLAVCARIFSPILFMVEGLVGRVLKIAGLNVPIERDLAISAEEISEMVELGSEAGEIPADEKEMIQGVFRFSDTVVREVMTPRKDIVAVEESATLEEVRKVFVNEGLSRVLVIGDSLDDVRGLLMAKDLMPLVGQGPGEFQVKQLMRLPYFVSNGQKIDDLLQELKREAIHFAVVLDEHGGVDGVVTIEDLIEEIVGDIFDEYDVPAEEVGVRKSKGGELLIDGSVVIDDLNDAYQLEIPTGEYDTMAGFVIHQLGRIPNAGEVVEFNSYRIRVEEVDQNRVTLVRLSQVKKPKDIKSLSPQSPETKTPQNESNPIEPESPTRVGNSGT